jgi:hypothetical protein
VWYRDGDTRSSDEIAVMVMEQRGVVIQLEADNNWKQEDLMQESKPCNGLNDKSRMRGDFQVRFHEKLRVRFPWFTRLKA